MVLVGLDIKIVAIQRLDLDREAARRGAVVVVRQVGTPANSEKRATTGRGPPANTGVRTIVRASGAGVNVPSRMVPLVWTARS